MIARHRRSVSVEWPESKLAAILVEKVAGAMVIAVHLRIVMQMCPDICQMQVGQSILSTHSCRMQSLENIESYQVMFY